MQPLVVIRPEPGASATLRAGRAIGLDMRVFPLFEVRALDWEPVPPGDVDALLLGSANALRHGGPALDRYRGLPAYVVGQATAAAAREAGLEVAAIGSGGLQQVLGRLAPGHSRLLRLAGRERVDLSIPAGVTVTTRDVYASEPLAFPAELTSLLACPAVILLHSGEAAAHFAKSCAEAGVDRAKLSLAAIGPRVAARAGAGWAALRSASEPGDAALLALAFQMCQDTGTGSHKLNKTP
ncbi:MAG TPA: uroporphyrinogen-III synthase [Novosphingobium sp.]|nr:uroporphyrinogen-III synthase [Novosphingobium sp.]